MRKAEIVRDDADRTAIRVEFIDDDGGCEVSIFSGPDAFVRAEAYAVARHGNDYEAADGLR
jgi:hypothetical protein